MQTPGLIKTGQKVDDNGLVDTKVYLIVISNQLPNIAAYAPGCVCVERFVTCLRPPAPDCEETDDRKRFALFQRSHGICPHEKAARPGIWIAISVDGPEGNLPILLARPQYSVHYTRQFSNLACQYYHQYGELKYPTFLGYLAACVAKMEDVLLSVAPKQDRKVLT